MIQWRKFFGGVHVASRSMKNRPSAKKKHPKIGLLVVVSVLAAVIVAGGVGVYAKKGFTHIDVREKRSDWTG